MTMSVWNSMEIPTPVCALVRNDSVVRGLGSPYGGAVTALAVTERALLSPLRGHLSHRERQGRLRRQPYKLQFFCLLRKADSLNSNLSFC